jgi:hypothetical protein
MTNNEENVTMHGLPTFARFEHAARGGVAVRRAPALDDVSSHRSQLADIMRQLARLFCDADPPLAQRCYSVARRLKSALPIGPAILAEVHALCDLFDPPDRRPRL